VRTPRDVRVGLSYACPAVVDSEGPPLEAQRGEIEALFASAVDGTRFLLDVGEHVALAGRHALPFADAEAVVDELARLVGGAGSLVERLCCAGALCALLQLRLDEGAGFAEAFERARKEHPALAKEALADPPSASIDRLSRAMFRTLVKASEPGRATTAGRLGGVVGSLFGSGAVRLQGEGQTTREVRWREVERVAPGLGPDGEALFTRWLVGALEGLTFFGDAAFGLPLASGLDLLVISAAVGAFLARAYAVGAGRSTVALDDAKRALRQIQAGIQHRGAMPRAFGRALDATASLDLLREQLA
jgi:hypothetical protein